MRDSLELERAATVLELTDIRLRLGEHHALAAELAGRAGAAPADERLIGQLMLALYRCGQPAEALRWFEQTRQHLADELGADPALHLQELHQQILRCDPALARPGPASAAAAPLAAPAPRLIGRDSELATLAGLVRKVADGRGSSVLIEGEPGIGKSALVAAALAGAATAGCQVFWGAGDELGQALPLLALREGLRVRELSANPRRKAIVRLLRGEIGVDRGTDVPAVLAEQLLALITEECAARPTILVVDDLQWADSCSIALWARLARSVRQVPLLLVGMMRPVPQREDLLALRRVVGGTVRLCLSGLTEVAVAELVASLVGGRPDDKLLGLADSAAGNPLYLVELVAALIRSSSVTVTGAGTAELTNSCAPGSLSAAIADRLGFVSGPVREVLRAAALLGVDFAMRDLAVVLGRDVRELIPAVDEARAAGVLAESGNGLGFRHPLIRAALYDEIPVPVRTEWHRDAGRALAEGGAPPYRVARQLLQAFGGPGAATEPMDEWILAWLARTAGPLVGQAPQVAAELLRQAVASSSDGSVQHDRLTSRLAEALYRVGDAAEAEQVANRALGHAAEPDLVVDLHWTLTECRMRSGRFRESLATLDQALATPGISVRRRARLLVLAARTHASLGEVSKAGQVAAAALALAEEAGDSWAMAWALHVLTVVAGMHGQAADALPLFDRALAVTGADPALADLGLLLRTNKAIVLGALGRYEEAFAVARQARDLAAQVGTVVRLVQAHGALGQLLFDTGRWDEALAEVKALPDDLKEPIAVCCDLGIAAVICFHRGNVAAARRYLAAAVPHATRIGNRVIGRLALACSLDREQAGAVREALALLTAGLDDNPEDFEAIEDLMGDAARLATETGDLATAQALAGHAAALAADSPLPHRQASALFCRGLVDHDAARLLAAAGRYDEASRPLLRARALEAAAGELVRAGACGQARAALTHAAEIYTSLGAATDVARLEAMSRGGQGLMRSSAAV
jgi:tetratricopeptide (TPR) repeat protein